MRAEELVDHRLVRGEAELGWLVHQLVVEDLGLAELDGRPQAVLRILGGEEDEAHAAGAQRISGGVELVHGDTQAGLFEQLTCGRLLSGLTEVLITSGEGPATLLGLDFALDDEKLIVNLNDTDHDS